MKSEAVPTYRERKTQLARSEIDLGHPTKIWYVSPGAILLPNTISLTKRLQLRRSLREWARLLWNAPGHFTQRKICFDIEIIQAMRYSADVNGRAISLQLREKAEKAEGWFPLDSGREIYQERVAYSGTARQRGKLTTFAKADTLQPELQSRPAA